MKLEHVNITVADANASAEQLVKIFGWRIRWQGASMDSGYTVHVGEDDSYVAYYSPQAALGEAPEKYTQQGAINHIGVVVDDLAATEARVRAAGYQPHSHYDYEPGERFYFNGPDGVEFEVVSYA
ncbi:MAG: VOC family protein [Cognatishimia sp.]|uniref:VOC family protein n=1 Tax=Cognatishimia sp. TaxID=2211648 RepID=UPI004058CC3A